MEILKDVFMDATMDSVRMLPFLFVAFLMVEAFEHYSEKFSEHVMRGARSAGPVIGALLGCVPQCGFSVMGANLYAGNVISVGTLLSIFLATSDEAILVILGNPGYIKEVAGLLAAKVVIAIIAGYMVNLIFGKRLSSKGEHHDICEHCGCHEEEAGILLPAWRHTFKIFVYIYALNMILDLLVELFGITRISTVMMNGTIIQPFITAIIGLIPNCAGSVILTQLYLHDAISFASVISGLCTGAGVGLLVLFRVNQDRKENIKILGLLYMIAVISGMILHVIL